MPRFSLRFVLADGRPTQADLESLWPDGPAVRRLDDGVLELLDGDTLLARVDLLLAEGGRGRAMLAAIREEAQRIGDDGVVQTVGFFCEGAAGVVLAQPVIDEEDDLERALEPLDALWEYLFEAHGGLLQVDGEGLYVEEGPLAEVP